MNTPNPANENKACTDKSYTRRSSGVRFAQRKMISRMLTLGHTQAEIGEHLGLSDATISREVAVLREGYKAQATAEVGEMKAAELGKLDEVESAGWAMHQRSNGSAEGLRLVMQALRQRHALLGLDTVEYEVLLRRAADIREAVMQVVLEEIRDPLVLERIAQRLQELAIEQKSGSRPITVEATTYEPEPPPPHLTSIEPSSILTPQRTAAKRRKATR